MQNNFNDYKAVQQLLEEYFDAVYRADIEKLKTIFHPSASMNGFLGDNMVIANPEVFYQDLQSKPSMKDSGIHCRCTIKNIEVIDGIASATLFVDNFFGAVGVYDQFHLLNCEGRWRILCKTFTTI